MNNKTPARANVAVLKQLLNHIPLGMINRHARETGVADKASVDFEHLFDLDLRGVWWVTRAKDNMTYRVVRNPTKGHGNIIKDQIVEFKGKHKGMRLRRVEALVEVDDELRVTPMVRKR